MNIFILDEDPEFAAASHCDKHVCKMILESGQMLCTAHWVDWLTYFKKGLSDFKRQRDAAEFLFREVPTVFQPPWKMTHVNHPSSVWTRESLDNYSWHSRLGIALCNEYEKRYGRVHKSLKVHRWLQRNSPIVTESKGLTPFAVCMPEKYKISEDPVACYRKYYLEDKVRFAKWAHSQEPDWWKNEKNKT